MIQEQNEEVMPLDFERVWGVPETEHKRRIRQSRNYCPEKDRLCLAWDMGCRAGFCVVDFYENPGG